MSTPINQLPKGAAPPAPSPEDPEVLNVLQEMEQEVQTATKANIPTMTNVMPSPMYPHMMPNPHMMMPPPPQITVKKVSKNNWVDIDILKQSAIVAIIAIVVYHPQTMEIVYNNVPKMVMLRPFDFILRGILVLVVVYTIKLYFGW
jgi:hypothetical protein